MTARSHSFAAGRLLRWFGLIFVVTCSTALQVDAAEKASVKGYVTQAGERIELVGVAAFKRGPEVVILFADKAIPEGSAEAFANKLLEDTGLKGFRMGLGLPGSELASQGTKPLYVQFLPGDGTYAYQSGGTPMYELEPKEFGPQHVSGRLHGTIVSSPEQIDVDVTFSTAVE